jgi:hypothetical protein
MYLRNDVGSLIHPFLNHVVRSHLVELAQQRCDLTILSMGQFLQVVMGPTLWFKYGKEVKIMTLTGLPFASCGHAPRIHGFLPSISDRGIHQDGTRI